MSRRGPAVGPLKLRFPICRMHEPAPPAASFFSPSRISSRAAGRRTRYLYAAGISTQLGVAVTRVPIECCLSHGAVLTRVAIRSLTLRVPCYSTPKASDDRTICSRVSPFPAGGLRLTTILGTPQARHKAPLCRTVSVGSTAKRPAGHWRRARPRRNSSHCASASTLDLDLDSRLDSSIGFLAI